MSILASIKQAWGHGDEEDYADDELLDSDEPQSTSSKYETNKYSSEKYAPAYGGGDGSSGRGRSLRSVPIPLRAREKNIYTLRPKNQDEAAIAADYLKSGSAVVMNLETVETAVALRIIDFMSGVCYGLEGQGHAMKLGDLIFLFTPAEFEISSDELDYGENRDFFFKSVEEEAAAKTSAKAPASPSVSGAATASTPFAGAATPAATQAGNTTTGYATADYAAPATAKMSSPSPTSIASTPASGQSTTVSSAVPISQPAQSTPLPSSSVYGSGGKAHVLVGGKPATISNPQSSYQSSERRSWER